MLNKINKMCNFSNLSASYIQIVGKISAKMSNDITRITKLNFIKVNYSSQKVSIRSL